MDDLIVGGDAPQAATPVKESDTENFVADVIEASTRQPVVVDFWAEWCGPCKTLGPILEKAVNAAGGKVALVKIDVDKNQMLAQQLRVQSIPTVFAFVNGQPVDGFAGAQPESQVKAFVERLAAQAPEGNGGAGDGGGNLEALVAAAEDAFQAGRIDEAAQLFGEAVKHDKSNLDALMGLARCHMVRRDFDQVRQLLALVPPDKKNDTAVAQVEAGLKIAQDVADADAPDEHRAAVEQDPGDHAARFKLARGLLATGETEAAIDHLLKIIERDREWEEGKAKAQLLTVFDALGPEDELVMGGRRRLSSILFS